MITRTTLNRALPQLTRMPRSARPDSCKVTCVRCERFIGFVVGEQLPDAPPCLSQDDPEGGACEYAVDSIHGAYLQASGRTAPAPPPEPKLSKDERIRMVEERVIEAVRKRPGLVIYDYAAILGENVLPVQRAVVKLCGQRRLERGVRSRGLAGKRWVRSVWPMGHPDAHKVTDPAQHEHAKDRIVAALRIHGRLTFNQLIEASGTSHPTVSRTLRRLARARVVDSTDQQMHTAARLESAEYFLVAGGEPAPPPEPQRTVCADATASARFRPKASGVIYKPWTDLVLEAVTAHPGLTAAEYAVEHLGIDALDKSIVCVRTAATKLIKRGRIERDVFRGCRITGYGASTLVPMGQATCPDRVERAKPGDRVLLAIRGLGGATITAIKETARCDWSTAREHVDRFVRAGIVITEPTTEGVLYREKDPPENRRRRSKKPDIALSSTPPRSSAGRVSAAAKRKRGGR